MTPHYARIFRYWNEWEYQGEITFGNYKFRNYTHKLFKETIQYYDQTTGRIWGELKYVDATGHQLVYRRENSPLLIRYIAEIKAMSPTLILHELRHYHRLGPATYYQATTG